MIRLADESITSEPGDCSDINAFNICKQKMCDDIKKSHRNALVEMKRCRPLTIQYTAIHGFYENRIMSLLHWLKQRANRDLKLISNQDTLSVLMSCQLAWNRWHMFCVQAFETNHQLKLMLNLKLTQSHRISSGTISMIRGKNDLYNIWYDLFVMCGMLTLPCAS